ncbi:MAG: NAD(+)/NADH kinase [Candidatus Peribacteraceae bacterium]|jgi:NAD+ kinase
MLKYRRVGVTAKSDLGDRDAVVSAVLEILRAEGAEVCFDAKRMKGLPSAARVPTFANEKELDLIVVIGGDGTILRTVRELKDFSIPILSVNRGAIGFLAELTVEEAPAYLPPFLHGEGVLEERSLLLITGYHRDGEEFVRSHVLNEAVISQGSIARLMNLRASVNGEDLTMFRADGLIISTPTGSTAYSLAAGGPIVHPGLTATILTPINSHTFTQKPIVIPSDQEVEVEVLSKENKFGDIEVSLTLDGQVFNVLQRYDRVRVSCHPGTVKFLRRKQDTFYATLRKKLKWGEVPTD